jgi:hypothetical protein
MSCKFYYKIQLNELKMFHEYEAVVHLSYKTHRILMYTTKSVLYRLVSQDVAMEVTTKTNTFNARNTDSSLDIYIFVVVKKNRLFVYYDLRVAHTQQGFHRT